MDPTTTYNELVLANRRDDRREGREYALALQQWLGKGGFLPAGITRTQCDSAIAYVLDPYGDKRDGVR